MGKSNTHIMVTGKKTSQAVKHLSVRESLPDKQMNTYSAPWIID